MKLFKNPTYLIAALAVCALLISSVALADKSGSSKSEVKKEQTSTESGSKAPATSSNVEKTPTKVTAKKDDLARTRELLRSQGTTLEEVTLQVTAPQPSATASAAGEEINWSVMAGGGNSGSSASYQLTSVIGQTAVGVGSSTNFGLSHGFLQNFGPTGCCIVAGDADGGGSINIGDVTYTIAYIFSGGPAASCCEEGDADGGGSINIGDVTYTIAYIFSGGPAPVCGPPGVTCSVS